MAALLPTADFMYCRQPDLLSESTSGAFLEGWRILRYYRMVYVARQ